MLLLLLYSPVLIVLPILLLAGIVFVVVPGGFIIVLAAAAYLLSVVSAGLGGLAGKGWQALRANRARTTAGPARRRPATRVPSRGPGAPAGASASGPSPS